MERDSILQRIINKTQKGITNLDNDMQSKVLNELTRVYNASWLDSFHLDDEVENGKTYAQVGRKHIYSLIGELEGRRGPARGYYRVIKFRNFSEPHDIKYGHERLWKAGWVVDALNVKKDWYKKEALSNGFDSEWDLISVMAAETVKKSVAYYEEWVRELIIQHALSDIRTAVQSVLAVEKPTFSPSGKLARKNTPIPLPMRQSIAKTNETNPINNPFHFTRKSIISLTSLSFFSLLSSSTAHFSTDLVIGRVCRSTDTGSPRPFSS